MVHKKKSNAPDWKQFKLYWKEMAEDGMGEVAEDGFVKDGPPGRASHGI